MRTFQVIVQREKQKPLAYQLVAGERALASMETLHARGLAVVAITAANGIEEQLSLDDMRTIYGEALAEA